MEKISVFDHVTVDGFFAGPHGEIDWFKVISKSLRSVEEGPNWKNIRILNEIRPEDILKLKEKEDITLMGSGTIVRQLANFGLIDEYSLAVVPIILGAGKPQFKDVKKMDLKLHEERSFKNRIVLLTYRPA